MKKIFTLAAIAASLIACSDNEVCQENPQSTNRINISATIADVASSPLAAPETKTSFGGVTGTTASWTNNDVIGLFCTQSMPVAVNDQFTVTGLPTTPVWTPTTAIYWKDGTTSHTFLAYYPYASGNTAAAVKLPNIGTQTGTLNPAFDFLISNNLGTTGVTRPGAVGLTFTHALSLVEFKIVLGSGLTAGTTLTSLTLASPTASDKLYTNDGTSTIALATGTITPGTLTTNTATITPGTPPVLSATATPIEILVLPGTFTAPTLAFSISESGNTITIPATATSNTIFAAGNKYSYTVTVSRTAITISNPTITDWTPNTGTAINPGI